MAKWPGLGDRIRECLQELGYWKGDKPDVMRFSLDHRYVPTYIYKWLGDTTPERENLERLAKDLGVRPAWLLFGQGVKKAAKRALVGLLVALGIAASVGAEAATPPAGSSTREMFLLGSWLRRLWVARLSTRKWATV